MGAGQGLDEGGRGKASLAGDKLELGGWLWEEARGLVQPFL